MPRFGINTTASGTYSFATGNNAQATSDAAFATGSQTIASGNWSTAMGANTDALGVATTALGNNTKAEAHSVTAIGRYNIGGGNQTSWVSTDPLFEIGIGVDDANRDNALTVLKNGKVGIGISNPNYNLSIHSGAGTSAAPRPHRRPRVLRVLRGALRRCQENRPPIPAARHAGSGPTPRPADHAARPKPR